MKKTAQNVKLSKSSKNSVEFSCDDLKISQKNLKQLLTSSLALYVLLKSKKPIKSVINDLFKIEEEAGVIINCILANPKEALDSLNLHGSLAGVFSYIKIKQDLIPKSKIELK